MPFDTTDQISAGVIAVILDCAGRVPRHLDNTSIVAGWIQSLDSNQHSPLVVSLLYIMFPYLKVLTMLDIVQPESGGEGDQGHSMLCKECLRNYCWFLGFNEGCTSFPNEKTAWQRSFRNLVPVVPGRSDHVPSVQERCTSCVIESGIQLDSCPKAYLPEILLLPRMSYILNLKDFNSKSHI